jgi:hypothetical protein
METNPTTEERRNLTWEGFRTMAAWFADKIHEVILEPIHTAQQIADTFTIRNVGSQENVEEIVKAFGTASDFEDGSQHYEFAGYDEDAETLAYMWLGEDNYTYRTAKRTPEVGDTIYENDGTDTGNTVTSVGFPTQLTVTQQWPGDEAATQHTVYDSIMYIGGEEVTV